MKPDNRVRYAERIDRVLAHLEQADFDPAPDLDALAAIAALSPFHFHRIYRLMTGETPAETVRRVRLARTAADLGREDVAITQAAGEAGYATSQSYARALRSVTGHSASDIRSGSTPPIETLLRPTAAGDTPLAVEIVALDPLRLLAIRNVGAYAELDRVYGQLFETVFQDTPMEALRGIWGVWHEDPRYTPADALHFDCAIDVGPDLPPPPGIEILAVPGGRQARQRHVGGYDTLHDSIDALYARTMAEGHAIADRPLVVNYVDDPESVAEAERRSDIYLPLDA